MELGDPINKLLERINKTTSIGSDNINLLTKEIKSKFKDATITKGNGFYNTKTKGDFEVQYVLSASAYLSVLRDIINYYTNLLMMIKQTHDIITMLNIELEAPIIIDKGHDTVDILIGPNLPNTQFLMEVPWIIEKEEIPTILNEIKGLSPEEKTEISNLLDQYLTELNKGIIMVETTIDVNNYAYPDKIKKAEEVLQG